jgi:tetratricopeptide (TPR) repeat protein
MKALANQGHLPIRPDTAVLCATIIIAPQLFGGAFPWSVIAIAGLSVAALATALWARRSTTPPVVDGLLIVMGVAWLFTCVQALPLSSELADALRLGSVENAERLRGLVWAGAVPFTISYDPGSTQLQILVGISIVAGFLAARLGGPASLKPIAMATVTSAVLIGLVGLAHQATGLDMVFGIYSPRFSAPRLLTPLMNGNHLGGFSLMGALIAAGLAAQSDSRGRHVWTGASVLCAVIVAWTASRGAIGSLLFGFVLLGAWLIDEKRSDRRRAAIPVAVVGASLAGVVAFAGLEPVLRRFETQGFDKLETAARSLGLLDGSAWWLGVGRGAFSAAFVTHEGTSTRVTHPENIIAQWVTEWGAPLSMVLFVVLILALWKRFRSTDQPLVAAVCVSIFALSLQNLVDFSLEMAGVVVVVAALLGALLPASGASPSKRSRKFLYTIFGALAISLTVLAPRVLQSNTQFFVDRLTRLMQVDDETRFQTTLQRGLALHPGEPSLALLAGTYAGVKRHSDATRWLAVVAEEAPGWAAPHAIAARWLLTEGRTDQALLAIREAERMHPRSGRAALCELLNRFPEIAHVERASPSAKQRIDYLNSAASCPGLDSALRAEIDALILRDEPTHATSVLRQAQHLSKSDRTDDAISLLQQALQQHPQESRLWMALVRAHLNADAPEQALSTLEAARSGGLTGPSLLEAQARIQAALGRADELRATAARLRGQSRGDPRLMARAFMLEGELEASLGNIDEALAAYKAADVTNPQTPALRHAAELAAESGRPTQARRLYGTLCNRRPGGSACTQKARLSKEAGGASQVPMP